MQLDPEIIHHATSQPGTTGFIMTATESSRPPFPCLWNERLYDCFMPLQILLNTTWQNVIVFRK